MTLTEAFHIYRHVTQALLDGDRPALPDPVLVGYMHGLELGLGLAQRRSDAGDRLGVAFWLLRTRPGGDPAVESAFQEGVWAIAESVMAVSS